ncbi:uncharacterized protein KD926_010537 [Aspergillus affinis]|uniref:uncharacterized protein n=1 Tax=Aspergillus affinis TaxID=1070780 RepID=UPI0022FF1426|nr:uncharacterized protein KD926_010537 [Aspergillus affinis]KAI9038697.1 hypothetical protein KD926_010537 [Aspergillus affinis]
MHVQPSSPLARCCRKRKQATTDRHVMILSRYCKHTQCLLRTRNQVHIMKYARIIIMSKIPGECVLDILPSLALDDRNLILAKLVELLEYIRLRGWIFFEQETEQVYYDEQTKKVYLIGFCRAVRESFPPERGKVITSDSIDVGGFGLG